MEKQNKFAYFRTIKLAPAIGDWTTIQYRDTDVEKNSISAVQNINFDSLPKEELRYLHYLHYRLAEKITKKMSKDLDIKVELHTILASQVAYEDFLKAHQDKVVQADFNIEKMGRVNVIFEWDLADKIVNRLTGGKGVETKSNEFSEVEQTILKTQIDEISPFFANAWRSMFKKEDIQVEFICGNYQHDKKITLREAYIMFTFYFYFGDGELKKVIWAYPNHVLRALLDKRRELPNPTKKRVDIEEATLEKIKVPVRATLGDTTITMSELKNLEEGDVISLPQHLNEPIKIQLKGGIKLHAQPGTMGDHICAQVLLWEGASAPVGPQFAPVEDSEEDIPPTAAVAGLAVPEPGGDAQDAESGADAPSDEIGDMPMAQTEGFQEDAAATDTQEAAMPIGDTLEGDTTEEDIEDEIAEPDDDDELFGDEAPETLVAEAEPSGENPEVEDTPAEPEADEMIDEDLDEDIDEDDEDDDDDFSWDDLDEDV